MIENILRMGRFTSSKVFVLFSTGKGEGGFGAGAITYINQRRAERTLGRSIDTGAYAQVMAWGKICEAYLCWKKGLLGIEYSLVSQETCVHPKYNFWSGSPDVITTKKVGEIKSYYPEKFYNYSKVLYSENLALLKKDFSQEYWQIVSNCAILGKRTGEAIAFTPTEDQLIDLRKEIEDNDFLGKVMNIPVHEQWQYRFVYEKPLSQLPYIPRGNPYPNLVKFEFEIPVQDIIDLTAIIIKAEELLNLE
jgi:hypothetical protein